MPHIETDQQAKAIRSVIDRKTANILLQMWLQASTRLYELNRANRSQCDEAKFREKTLAVIEDEMFTRNLHIVWTAQGYKWQVLPDGVSDIPF